MAGLVGHQQKDQWILWQSNLEKQKKPSIHIYALVKAQLLAGDSRFPKYVHTVDGGNPAPPGM